MTTIAAIHDKKNKGIWIASDMRTNFDGIGHENEGKWIIHGNWAIGTSGYLRMHCLLENYWKDIVTNNHSIFDIMIAVRQMVKDDGYVVKDEAAFPVMAFDMIVTDSNSIWQIGSDFSHHKLKDTGFCAVGSGGNLALGALYALTAQSKNLNAKQAIQSALEAASRYDSGTGQELFIRFLKNKIWAVGRKK